MNRVGCSFILLNRLSRHSQSYGFLERVEPVAEVTLSRYAFMRCVGGLENKIPKGCGWRIGVSR